ncbi:hypothetical protein BASA84_000915 [Batrachochytrium salamandrivorans]|nr:hypothetical protein BASA84_000915 [Batrachochytrium salamandrivorans]
MTARHSLSTAYAADSPKEASSLDPKMAVAAHTGLSGPSRSMSIITVLAILLAGVAVLNRTFKVHFSEDSDTLFRQTVVLISLDGFRPDYLNRGLTPNLNAIAKNGIQAAYMQPSFPSVTFPNHYSIVTGLYPESHGLVDWATAVLQGCPTTHWRKFNWSMTSDEKIEQALEWIDLPQQERPLFISLYFAEIDSAGHTYGVYSKEVNAALQKIDHAIGELFLKLQKRRIENLINLVIVSDHGMADSSEDRVIYLGDDVDFSFSQVLADGPLLRIYPEKDIELVSQS